jgi:hypothetical protein
VRKVNSLCIAVHDEILAAALAVPNIKQPLNSSDTMRFRQYWHQAGNTPYPAWYLFGSLEKRIKGLVAQYAFLGFAITLLPASLLDGNLAVDKLDVQLCTLSDELYQHIRCQGIEISGYCPESFASKAKQAEHIRNNGGQRFLPHQVVIRKNRSTYLPTSESGLWLLKEPHGSAGRNRSGSHYTVWTEAALCRQLPVIAASLPPGEELICSEFVLTNDPYAHGAEHVVHKMHFCAGKDGKVHPYGKVCQRFIHPCNRDILLRDGLASLPAVTGQPIVTTGLVDSLDWLQPLADTMQFCNSTCIFSVDFMIQADGTPRFLECNKLAATFAEQFDPFLPPVIDTYPML